jgi:hypothetical protein
MPFLPPLIGAVGAGLAGVATFLGSGTFLAGIANLGLGLAAQFVIGQIFEPKPPAQAVRLETRYGEDLAREIILGKVATAGHQVHRNASGKGNRNVRDAYVLSHFRVTAVTRFRHKGEWRALEAPVDGDGYQTIDGSTGRIKVRLHAGTMGQATDAKLVSTANPPTRWTVNHRLAGCAYLATLSNLNREGLPQPWECFVEVQGAPLYDWRKDDTVGGTGTHRWGDQDTWEYSENPVLMMYALERGFFNGTQLMVGKGVAASRLPLAEWTIAANICDETIAGKARYRAALIATAGRGVTHEQNMQPLLAACAASWVENASGEYPIVGANQAVVATITDSDLMVDEAVRFSHKRTRSELVNTATGSYVSPETFYQSAPITQRQDDIALAVDGERLAVSIPYSAVTDPAVADRLLDIALRASRYQANGEICIRPKFIRPKPGQWIRWNSEKNGDRKFQIVQKRLGAIGSNSARNVYWTLQEVGDGIFDPTAYETLPPDIIATGAADYQSELAGYGVIPLIVQTATGSRRAAIRAAWSAIDDLTITHVDFEYRPVDQPDAVQTKTATADQTVEQLVSGVISLSNYEVRYRLRSDPVRTIPWTAWVPVTTLDARIGAFDIYDGVLGFPKFKQDVQDWQQWIGQGTRETIDSLLELATEASTQDLANFDDKQTLRRELVSTREGITASYTEAIIAATGPGSALVQRIETLEVKIPTLATVTAVDALTVRVDANAAGIAVNANAITSINAQLPGLASVTALNALTVRVTDAEGDITVNADAITALTATLNGVSASANFRASVYAGPAGYSSRIGLEARVGGSGVYRSASLFLDVPASTSSPTRVAIVADQFIITDGTNNASPFVFSGGVARMNMANIGTVNAGIIQGTDGKMIMNLANSNIIMSDNT